MVVNATEEVGIAVLPGITLDDRFTTIQLVIYAAIAALVIVSTKGKLGFRKESDAGGADSETAGDPAGHGTEFGTGTGTRSGAVDAKLNRPC